MIETRKFLPGEIIIKEKEFGETGYIIKKGCVSISKEMASKRVHLCDLKSGSIFGEMSMIDDKPRSATATAIEETVVQEIHKDRFFTALESGEEIAVQLLKVLFERLRKADAYIARQHLSCHEIDAARLGFPKFGVERHEVKMLLEGKTRCAKKTLQKNPIHINKFPFLIGRESRDPLAYNDLKIEDQTPYRISRHHVEIDIQNDIVTVTDRGSHLGTIVNGRQIGGSNEDPGPVELRDGYGTLILGDKRSPYKYRIDVLSV